MRRAARCAVILSLAKDLALPVPSPSSFAVLLPLVAVLLSCLLATRHSSLVTFHLSPFFRPFGKSQTPKNRGVRQPASCQPHRGRSSTVIFPLTSIVNMYAPATTISGTRGLRVRTSNTSVSSGTLLRM